MKEPHNDFVSGHLQLLLQCCPEALFHSSLAAPQGDGHTGYDNHSPFPDRWSVHYNFEEAR